MVMKFTPSPTFIVCDTKVFQPKELHCTRLYNRSVLILMMDGELRFREDGKLFTLLPGEYYIQRNGLLQEGVPMDKPPIYFWIEFHASYSEDAIGLPLRGTFRMLNVVPLIERMEDLFHHHRADPFKLNSYMLRIFSELLSSSNYIDEKYNTAHLVRQYINANYPSQITLNSIAQKFNYNKDYIIRIFKEQYKITPHQYLIQVRMEHARWMLENTTVSADQTAVAVGYSDFSAFYRCFRKTFGISPGAIRPPEEKQAPTIQD